MVGYPARGMGSSGDRDGAQAGEVKSTIYLCDSSVLMYSNEVQLGLIRSTLTKIHLSNDDELLEQTQSF